MEHLFGFNDVTTRQCFSEHVFDAFECDELEPVGVPLYLAIKDVGSSAIQNRMQLTGSSRQQKQAIQWLEANELAHNGILFPEAVAAQTTIGSPVAMTGSTFDTAFGRRQRLLKSGWELSSGRAASANSTIRCFKTTWTVSLCMTNQDISHIHREFITIKQSCVHSMLVLQSVAVTNRFGTFR